MRRVPFGVLAVLALAFAFMGWRAGAETQWVGQEQFSKDPADPAVAKFVVDVRESGSYQIHLTARAESKRPIELQLTLRPEAGGAGRTVRFSFIGAGCG
jgi:hypothetical protein